MELGMRKRFEVDAVDLAQKERQERGGIVVREECERAQVSSR